MKVYVAVLQDYEDAQVFIGKPAALHFVKKNRGYDLQEVECKDIDGMFRFLRNSIKEDYNLDISLEIDHLYASLNRLNSQ